MMFIYCNWQRSVNIYKNKKETAIYTKGETIHKTIQKHRIHKTGNKRKKNIKKHKSSN